MPIRLRQYVEDYDDLSAANRAYLADLEALGAGSNDAAGIAFRLAVGLQGHVDRLNQAFEGGDVPTVLSPSWRADASVFVGNAGKRFWTRRVGNRVAVLIDLDLVVRLVLSMYMVGINKEEDVVAQALASFLFLSIVVPRDEEFPLLFELLFAVSSRDGRVINDLFLIVGDFVLFHEVGHSYVYHFGTGFARVAFQLPAGVSSTPDVVRSLRIHPDGPIFNQIELPGTQNGLLVLSPKYERWKDEFASDVFAVYAGVLAPAEDRPGSMDLEQFVDGLACWQHVLYPIGWREQYMRAIAGEADIAAFSHPTAHTRMDLVLHHINYLAEEFAPDWQSPALGRFKAHYDSLWAADLAELVDGIQYVRYAFDEEGPHVNIGKIHTFTGEPVPFYPSALSKLEKNFLRPFLAEVRRIGWDRAVENGKERYIEYFETFRLNDRPIMLELGGRLHDINLKRTFSISPGNSLLGGWKNPQASCVDFLDQTFQLKRETGKMISYGHKINQAS